MKIADYQNAVDESTLNGVGLQMGKRARALENMIDDLEARIDTVEKTKKDKD